MSVREAPARRSARRPVLAAVCACALTSASEAGEPRSPTILDLLSVTDLSGLSASPDGRWIAFRTERADVERNSYALGWRVVSVDGGPARVVGGGGQPIYVDPGFVQTEDSFWSPDSRAIFYRALIGNSVGIWRAAVGGGVSAIVDRDADVERPELAADMRSLSFRLGPTRDSIQRAENEEYDGGILVDASVDVAQNLFRGGSINGRMATQRLTGRWFARDGLLWREPRVTYRLDFETMKVERVGASAASVAAPVLVPVSEITARSASGDVAAATWNGRTGGLALRAVPGRPERRCAAPACLDRVQWLAWRPGTQEVLFATRDSHSASSLYLWNTRGGAVRAVSRGAGLLSGGRSPDRPCAVTAVAAICVSAGAVEPPRLERIDLRTGGKTALFDPNPALRARVQPRVERLSWRLGDGREASGILLAPAAGTGRRLPLFINYYRCDGYLRGGEGDEWPFAALAEAGFAVACLDTVAGEVEPNATAYYETALEAIGRLVDRLDRDGRIDRRRIGMGGLSFGSEVTMWVAMHSDLLRAASIASPQIEPAYYWFNALPGRDQPDLLRRVWKLGAPDETPERWRQVSPALNTRRISAPLLLQLPEQEARLVMELYVRLRRAGVPAELHAFPDEAHFKVRPRHRLAAYRRNLDWFRFWLQDHVDAGPDRAAQYRRWRALKARRATAASAVG